MEKKKGKKDVSILMTPLCARLIIGYPFPVVVRALYIVNNCFKGHLLKYYTDGL